MKLIALMVLAVVALAAVWQLGETRSADEPDEVRDARQKLNSELFLMLSPRTSQDTARREKFQSIIDDYEAGRDGNDSEP